MLFILFCFFCLLNRVIGDIENSPRIVIVGAGGSGIAAASKLYENGFQNILILEAENRIGGRICTVQFGDYLIDLGAQWVHGQVNNVAYALAAPLDLLANSTWQFKAYDSSGKVLDNTIFLNAVKFFEDLHYSNVSNPTGSVGEYYEQRFTEYFKDHPEINSGLQKDIIRFFDLATRSLSSADTWDDLSLKGDLEYEDCEGVFSINWKTRGYSTILDILIKKIPDVSQELPIINNTLLNKEVVNIDYTDNNNGSIKIRTLDEQEYLADHVIVTTSLGTLKENYGSWFNPALPESKVTSIKNLHYGTACKIFLHFDEPWWEHNIEWRVFSLLFNESYINELEKDANKKWITSTISISAVEYKPQLLSAWVTPKGCQLVETLPDNIVLEHLMDMMHTFLGKDYNITRPTAIMRSKWTTNKHFRGTYSYRSVESEMVNASAGILSEPLLKNQTPVILFAGEATSENYYSTVHGAIGSGWREADRLIKFYKKTS